MQYVAGYQKTQDGKWPGPGQVKIAILQMVAALYNLRACDPALTVDTMIGVGSQQYSADGSKVLTETALAAVEALRLRDI